MQLTSDEAFAELNASFDAATIEDPHAVFAEKRATAPVMEGDILFELGLPSLSGHGGERRVFSIFGYEDVSSALRDHETFSSAIWLETFEPLAGRVVLGLDGEEHRFWRGVMLPVFTRKAVANWDETVVRPTIRNAVEEFRASGETDLVRLALHFPVQVTYRIIGLAEDEAFYERFKTLGMLILLGLTVDTDMERMMQRYGRAMEAAKELYDIVLPVVARRRAEGATGDDLISHLVNAEFEGKKLDDDEITGFIRALLVAATENTTRQFLIAITLLLQRPELLDRVRRDRSLLMNAVVEAERFDAAFGMVPRVTTRDIELGGTAIPAGSAVLLMLGSANRDETVFADADTFDLDRGNSKVLTFGLGRHVCPGMNIAIAQMVAGLDAILDLLPDLRWDPDAAPLRIRGANVRGPATVPVIWN